MHAPWQTGVICGPACLCVSALRGYVSAPCRQVGHNAVEVDGAVAYPPFQLFYLFRIVVAYGPECGLMQHYGWYEDAGSKTAQADFENRWLTVYVALDGRMERVYINDRLVSEKDIQLLVKPSQFVTLGRNSEGDWPFTGLVGSITLWDEYIPKN